MALLRILLSLSIGVFSVHAFANASPPAGAKATEPLSPDIAEIQSQAKSIQSQASSMGVASGAAVVNAATNLKSTGGTCEVKKTAADWVCLENANSSVVDFVKENNEMISLGIMVGSSLGEQCKGLSNMLSKASMVLGAFQATCKVAQTVCNSTCAKVMPNITTLQTSLTTVQADSKAAVARCQAACAAGGGACCASQIASEQSIIASASAINAKLPQVKMHTSKKELVCNEYQVTTQSAMMGAITALKGFAQTKACEKANKDSQIASVNCFDSAAPGYSTPNCQCARGEKSAAECQNINVDPATIKQASINAPKPVSAADGAGSPTGGLGSISGGDEKAKIAATSGGDGSAPPVDGGGGGMGGGGSGGGYGQDGAGTPRRLNTNILGGGFGGGGGGGGSGAGAGYGEMDSNLKTYMPGGANDPNRSIASQLAKEVTPQAGRTNWEKVRLRYRDNTGSLLNK